MTKEDLHERIARSTGNESNICQICAIRNGRVVYEDCWRGFKAEDAVNINSVTKGVVALLAGIAIDKGLLKGVDDKVIDYFPDYPVKRGEKTIYDVTLKHLLTMTAPYKYPRIVEFVDELPKTISGKIRRVEIRQKDAK